MYRFPSHVLHASDFQRSDKSFEYQHVGKLREAYLDTKQRKFIWKCIKIDNFVHVQFEPENQINSFNSILLSRII